MSLAGPGNNELITVRELWHVHQQSKLSGQFLLPAALHCHCSQQWRIMTTEHNRGLFSSLDCFVSHCFPLSALSLIGFLCLHFFWLLVSIYYSSSQTNTLTHSESWTGVEMWGIKLFRRLAESVTIDEHQFKSLHSRVFIYGLHRMSTKATAQIISCSFSESKWDILTFRETLQEVMALLTDLLWFHITDSSSYWWF